MVQSIVQSTVQSMSPESRFCTIPLIHHITGKQHNISHIYTYNVLMGDTTLLPPTVECFQIVSWVRTILFDVGFDWIFVELVLTQPLYLLLYSPRSGKTPYYLSANHPPLLSLQNHSSARINPLNTKLSCWNFNLVNADQFSRE